MTAIKKDKHSKFGHYPDSSAKEVSDFIIQIRFFLEVATTHGLKYLTKEKWRSEFLWLILVCCCLALPIIFQIIPRNKELRWETH